jgi:hypothetical protein
MRDNEADTQTLGDIHAQAVEAGVDGIDAISQALTQNSFIARIVALADEWYQKEFPGSPDRGHVAAVVTPSWLNLRLDTLSADGFPQYQMVQGSDLESLWKFVGKAVSK